MSGSTDDFSATVSAACTALQQPAPITGEGNGRAVFDAMVRDMTLTDRNWALLARLGWVLAIQPNWVDILLIMFSNLDAEGLPAPE